MPANADIADMSNAIIRRITRLAHSDENRRLLQSQPMLKADHSTPDRFQGLLDRLDTAERQ